MLEEEIQIGEREREGLRIETQRLRDELSDLKIESEIRMEKLRLAEATIEKHHQRAVSNHLAKESHTLRPRSPFSEASTTNTNMSSPTAASTPPYSMQPDGLRPDSTPPSPPLSDAPLAIRPIPFNPPMPTRKLSIASRDPADTPVYPVSPPHPVQEHLLAHDARHPSCALPVPTRTTHRATHNGLLGPVLETVHRQVACQGLALSIRFEG
jgi:hypothetical protein